jgi:heme oxygenase (biliverdin-IX-beta and delta-forming)
MITERLKAETAQLHRETEQVSHGDKIMSGRLTPADYTEIIEKNYIMHALVEKALAAYAPLQTIGNLNIDKRYKTESLEKDLNLLGKALPSVPAMEINIHSVEEALGMMYVLEGATLGGAYILKALQRTESMKDIQEYNYYGVYGEMIGPNWKAFQQVLLDTITTKEQEDKTIAAASKAFELFKQIFTGSQASA